MCDHKNNVALESGSSRNNGASGVQTRDGKIRTYEELQRQILNALRDQNPDWIEPDGSSPIFESYQKRFAELLAFFGQREKCQVHLLDGRPAHCACDMAKPPLGLIIRQ
jgi:hypothetical protein